MEKYNTAEDAFNSLNIGTRFNKVDCRKALQKIVNAHIYPKRIPRPSLDEMTYHFDHKLKFVNKSIRLGMTVDGNVVMFADVYGDYYNEGWKRIENIAKNNNINIEKFHKSYGSLEFENGWKPPENTKYEYSGYSKFYRGNLVGFIITPHTPP